MSKLMAKIRQNKKAIYLYLLLFVLMLVLCRATITKSISPFGFSFAFSMILLQKNAILVSISYFLCAILFNLSLEGLIVVGVTTSCLILLSLIFKIIKKRVNLISTIIFLIFSQAGYLYFNIQTLGDIFNSIAMIIVAILFVYICNQTFSALFYRGISSRLTLDESICLSLFMIAFFSGLYGLYVGTVNLTNALVVLILLFASAVFRKTTTIYLSILAGFGMAFASASVTLIAVFVTFGVLCSTLSDRNRFFAPILILLCDIVFGMFLNAYADYSYLTALLLLVSLVIYVCIPRKLFRHLKGYSFSYDGSLSNEYILAGQKEEIKQKLERTGKLFRQMQSAYKTLSLGEIDRKSAAVALEEELFSRHCSGCINYETCLSNSNMKTAITSLFEFGLAKGKVTLIDANNLLTGSCVSLTSMIEEINQSLSSYFEFEKTIKEENSGKMIISDQLGSTSNILTELSNFAFGGEKINDRLSLELLDEFTINQVVVNECVVLEGAEGVTRVIIIVRNIDALSDKLLLCLKSVLKLNFVATNRKFTRLAGWSVVCFKPAPKYKVQIGYASAPASDVSGDTYSFLNLNNNRCLFALSDGMGHGKRANQISSSALGLIENFYRTGFSSETIINSVNKLIVPSTEENFACLDACIVDLKNATADFIKVGASISLIKSENTTKIVEGQSAPLGIIQNIKASAIKEILHSQDVIILASDGVVDRFASFEEFSNYVNNERIINVQMLADTILEEAQSRDCAHKDDMSVIAIKIVNNF